jgi:HAD superfamily hydrolase (TIGR01509 family)
MIKYVLFDLDGTVLPMDQDKFIKLYFGALAKKLAPLGYTPDEVVAAIWDGTRAMLKNTGGRINEELFWDRFGAALGDGVSSALPLIDEFYVREFFVAREACSINPKIREVLDLLHERNIPLVLATNPVFPLIASETRMQWGGARPDDFLFITTYSNSHYCKPNPDYYRAILDTLHVKPEECVMVGNDVGEDMIAAKLGMQVFLLTDCLINKNDTDISQYPHGGFDALLEWIGGLNL